ncbi:MAG TPA: serine hydrolase domain-containing protein, partial [Kofleriaceae bacterium]|nr:serine hydrolase domain-containing protein [Kofleriaceae bacterium]
MFASPARIALCLLTVSCGGSSAQLPDDETPSPLTQDRIDRIRTMVAGQHQRQGYPAMAAGVIVNGHLAWQEGFGTLGEEAQPVTSQTVFRIGSITKVITSLAVLRLRDAGKLKLGDPAAHYLPELVDTLSQPGKPAITVRHLVTHSSGIPSLGNGQLDWTGGERDIGVGDILDALRGVEPEFPPGERVKYSNLGMALAGLVVARTSGQQYRRYIEERFLRPLGMQSTVWDREAVPPERLAPGHWRRSGGYEPAGPHWKLGTLES